MPNTDPEDFGGWLHAKLVEACGVDRTAWVVDTIDRAMHALRPCLGPWARLTPVVLWIQDLTAFTAPGTYIYIGRRLVERCAAAESMAFVIAHEAAHHELGHLNIYHGWAERIPRLGPAPVVAALYRLAVRQAYGPEEELAADRRAMELCIKAGFNGRTCLHLFDVLQDEALNKGDLDGVFGAEDELDPETKDKWYVQAGTWMRQRMRGYMPLAQRRQELIDHFQL